MTRDDILAMNPGNALNLLVGKTIFGYTEQTVDIDGYAYGAGIPEYSTDISAAWDVADKFYYVDIRKVNKVDEDRRWKWTAWVSRGDGSSRNATADTAAEAICKAALLVEHSQRVTLLSGSE